MQCPICKCELARVGKFLVCLEHGQVELEASTSSPPRAVEPQRVFISYGRADGLDFARRLAADLERRGRHHVWFDLENIEQGGLFEVRIERGIHDATVFAAVMTRRSLEENSVCRDEVVFALNEGKKVVPVRADPDPTLKPTLLLARRNWVDFTRSYEEGLDAFLRYLAGDESAILEPRLPTVTGVAPLDFSVEIAKFSAGFTGRGWLSEDLDRWLAADGQRAFVLVAEPGVGKSAIAAWLSRSRRDVVAIHFCTEQNTRSRDPHEFVASLVGQLHTQLPGFAEVVEAKHPEVRRRRAADAFRELVVEPARSLAEPPQRQLIIVDSLDEAAAQEGETVLDVLVTQARDLPSWLRIVATSRPEESILRRIRNLSVLELSADGSENRTDLREFVRARLSAASRVELKDPAGATAAARIESLAEGNFLYARLALDALEDGSLSVADLGQLTPGLAVFYSEAFRRRFSDLDVYTRAYAPLLRTLAVARGPLSLAVLRRICGEPEEVLQRRLLDLRTYLRVFGQGESASYALFHRSLQEWLTDRDAAAYYWCQASAGHAHLSDVLAANWRTDGYALRHLPAHLIGSAQWDALAGMLCDLEFLEAKARAGLVFGLAGDFSQAVKALPADHPTKLILRLLEEAIRRDIHFIARHPTTLFQCLWNSGWWYDCPEAAGHYDPPTGGGPPGEPPWEQPGAKLHELLQTWRDAKEKAAPGFLWVRSLRPPPTHLGTAQEAVLRAHEGPVTSVAASPDGRWVVSGSKDGTVRVWDAESGQDLPPIRGHEGAVRSVAASPDGQRILSGSVDRTVRVWDAESGQELRCLRGHAGVVYQVASSPDGRRIAGASEDGTVRTWDAESGEERLCLRGHQSVVRSVAYSPDGRRVVSGSQDKMARVWDAESGRELQWLRGHQGYVLSVAYSPDGQRIATGSEDATARLWDARTGVELRCLRGHASSVSSVAFSPDGRRIVSGSHDRTVRLWDADTGKELRCFRGHQALVRCVAYSPDGCRIFSGSEDQTVRVWDAENDQRPRRLRDHASQVRSLASSPDGRRVASGSQDQTVRVWDAGTGRELLCLRGHGSWVRSVAFSPDSRRLASGSQDQTVHVWDAETGQTLSCLRGHLGWVLSVAYSPDGRRIVTGSIDRTVRVWDAESGEEVNCLRGQGLLASHVAYSPGGGEIIARSLDGTAEVWDAETGGSLGPLEGRGLAAAKALGTCDALLRARPGQLETFFEDAGTGEPVAWFPVPLDPIAAGVAGRAWAGADASSLHILRVEGKVSVWQPGLHQRRRECSSETA